MNSRQSLNRRCSEGTARYRTRTPGNHSLSTPSEAGSSVGAAQLGRNSSEHQKEEFGQPERKGQGLGQAPMTTSTTQGSRGRMCSRPTPRTTSISSGRKSTEPALSPPRKAGTWKAQKGRMGRVVLTEKNWQAAVQ